MRFLLLIYCRVFGFYLTFAGGMPTFEFLPGGTINKHLSKHISN